MFANHKNNAYFSKRGHTFQVAVIHTSQMTQVRLLLLREKKQFRLLLERPFVICREDHQLVRDARKCNQSRPQNGLISTYIKFYIKNKTNLFFYQLFHRAINNLNLRVY